MREHVKKPENQSRTLDSNPKASSQVPIDVILQRYKERNVQRYLGDEELIQGKSNGTVQREEFDEGELLQGKFDTAQREEIEKEELLQGKFRSVPVGEQVPIQREERPNNTGLPDNLKIGIENLSGYSMDDVKVHYNSDKPAQLQALAYAQGTDIHVAPGQEQHLPHEAWHVVQQKQGRVRPTTQLQGVNVNDNEELEKEADKMGKRGFNDYISQRDYKDVSSTTQCMQLQITMSNKIYSNFFSFIKAYALHFGINSWEISGLVWDYLEYAFNNNLAFPSYNAIIQQVMPRGNFLPLPIVFLFPGSLCTINMQGARLADCKEAEAISGINKPSDYTWHHIEGIVNVSGSYRCNMVLVRSDHHAQHHIGAVSQYEKITGRPYG